MNRLVLNVDGAGASVGGPGGWGAVLEFEGGGELDERRGYLENATNNQAEYTALIRGLELALEYQPAHLHVISDSRVVLFQVVPKWWTQTPHGNGPARLMFTPAPPPRPVPVQPFLYKCKKAKLRSLHACALRLLASLPSYALEWNKGHHVDHAANDRADKLATRAMKDKAPLGPLPA